MPRGRIFGLRSLHPKIPFPVVPVGGGTESTGPQEIISCRQASSRDRIYCGFNPNASNCRLHSAGASRSPSTPMPRGERICGHAFLPLRLLTNATCRSFSFTGSFALFRSPALVEVAAEPIEQPRNVFVGSLNRGEPRSGGEHERRE